MDGGGRRCSLVIGNGDPKGIGPEEVGVGGVGPVSVRKIDGCGSVCGNRGDRKVGTVGQTVRVGGVEVTGGGSVLGDGCLGVPRYGGGIIDRTDGQVDGGGRGCALVIGYGDLEGIGPEEVGVGGVGPVSVRGIDGCGSVCGNRGDRKVGTVGQTVRVGGVEVTGGGSVLGDGCLGVPRYAGCIIDRTDGQVDGGGRGCSPWSSVRTETAEIEGIGPEEVGVAEGAIGCQSPVRSHRIDGCGSVWRRNRTEVGDRKVGTVGQTVRVGGVEVTGCGSVLGDGCLGVPRYGGRIIDRTDGQVDGDGIIVFPISDLNREGIRSVIIPIGLVG